LSKTYHVKTTLVEVEGNGSSGTFKETLISSIPLDDLVSAEHVKQIVAHGHTYIAETKVTRSVM